MYRQTTTLRHSSTAQTIDASDATAVSGHLDGGVRFWDLRSGERSMEIKGTYILRSFPGLRAWRVPSLLFVTDLHHGGVSSVQYSPVDSFTLLTNGLDSTLHVVDLRRLSSRLTLRADGFVTLYSWSSACFSPNGRYVAAGSSRNNRVYVWDTATGTDEATLTTVLSSGSDDNDSGVCGIAWGATSTNGSQLSSLDRHGVLTLWG